MFKIDSHESNSSPAGLGFYEKVRRFLPVSKSLEMAFSGGGWMEYGSTTSRGHTVIRQQTSPMRHWQDCTVGMDGWNADEMQSIGEILRQNVADF